MSGIAILVPTLGRPDKLAPLVANALGVAQVPTTVYFVVEADDQSTLEAIKPLESIDVIGTFGSCAKALNAGYLASCEPFVFTANDDLLFHQGWDTAALAQMETADVVGTNDGNGRMTCFSLVRRSFIEEHSGVYDQPNTLCHPYTSQYVDTELAEYAKARGVWGEAPDSLSEHLHWEFGKASPNHPNYQKAQATCAEDRAVYEQRRAAWTAHLASA